MVRVRRLEKLEWVFQSLSFPIRRRSDNVCDVSNPHSAGDVEGNFEAFRSYVIIRKGVPYCDTQLGSSDKLWRGTNGSLLSDSKAS